MLAEAGHSGDSARAHRRAVQRPTERTGNSDSAAGHLRDGVRVDDGAHKRRQHARRQQRRVVLQEYGQRGQQRDRALALGRHAAAQVARQALQRGCAARGTQPESRAS
jgi:hypothetical protein